MKKIALFITLAFLALTAFAQTKLPAPVAIDPTKDTCASCNMEVANSGYAAEIIGSDGKVFKFDSVVEAAVFIKKHTDLKVAAFYVQHAQTKAWIESSKALYVFTKEVKTPMNIGIHAFATDAEAQAFVKGKKDGQAVAYADLEKYSKKMAM